ncbi:hypothetical protein V6N13_023149 [Hibiscus sabdariffa]
MHGLPEWTQVSIFYNSVNTPTMMMLDASANGTLLDKPPREAALKSLENQVGQISQALNTRPLGGFPSDTEVAKGATHEQCKAITTRSGKVLPTPKNKQGEETAVNYNAAAVPDKPASAGEDQRIPPDTKEAYPGTTTAPRIRLPRTDTMEDTRPPPPFP